MSDSVFTKIINGEIPAYKVYEDDKTLAFLDIHPVQPGHTLVIPKVEVDHIWDLSPEDYKALMDTVKKVGIHLKRTLGAERIIIQVIGFDVPHTHVHLIPCNQGDDFRHVPDQTAEPDFKALQRMAEKLKF